MRRFDETLHRGYRQSFDIQSVLFEDKTEHQHLLIFETPELGRVMTLDGIVQVTERDEFVYHEMMAHVPLFALAAPKEVLIIGGGDGGVLREALRHRGLERVTMVELDRTVIDLSREYMPAISAGAFDDARTDLVIGDGLDYVATSQRRFDVIIVDSTDPIGPGEVLFTEKFYADCKRCLKPSGIVATQNGVPFFQPDEVTHTYRRMGRAFAAPGFYVIAMPTYVGGFMTLGWGCDEPERADTPLETLTARFRDAGLTMRYYTPELHRAAFALPQYVRDLMV
ncbi:polyamine aminopropyltransferase [Varunaivibrio sulfuroxidans]|uniref:Polyamine aminopropyltransferase n=1 Tax=Varunaivibrio sulfuroxidans TaxID=1773489 RepID=A0A4R3JAX0_9PROT|nr:polyamine aminopropyltransferase [Varunaivibrio sulfuroxidans]TCS63028.1 spermidine synthase [Varunaivibrio sulfuroxidans]WES31895.1 polyamine aminopropyltransferase [Varunaivibrio sulfuroxidans]